MLLTPIFEWHSERAKMIEFAGWEMPLWYHETGLIAEHEAVRNSCGIFDISHMGRILVQGKDAESFLNLIVCRDISRLDKNRAGYTFFLNEEGGIRDDVVILKEEREDWFFIVCNGINRLKIFQWLESFKNFVLNYYPDLGLEIKDLTMSSAMFAVQGPNSLKLLEKIGVAPPRWGVIISEIGGVEVISSGTGYTGESGGEIIVLGTSVEENERALMVWNVLLEGREEFDIKPCGLGARDTLRLEAGLALYGNDIDEKTTPIEARLDVPVFVSMDKEWFVGKTALERKTEEPIQRTRIGFIMDKKGPNPRYGYKIKKDGEVVGEVTSGMFAPTVKRGAGMAYVKPQYAEEGMEIEVIIREKGYAAKVSKFPLFDETRYGWRRKSS